MEASPPPASEPIAPVPGLWHWLIPLLKALLIGGLVYYVIAYRVTPEQVDKLRKLFLSPLMLGLGFAAFSAQIFLCAQRLRTLLAAQGTTLPYLTMIRLTYLGAFFDTFMFTSVGGDAVKAVYLAREYPAGKRLEAVSVMVMDRLLGLLALLALMLLAAGVEANMLREDPDVAPYLLWILLPPALMIIGTAGLLSESVYASKPMRTLLKYIPFGVLLNRAYFSLQQFRNCPAVLGKAGGLSLLVHISGVVGGYILMRGLDCQAPFGAFFVAWFIANLLCSFLPVGGIGGGQLIYDVLFMKIADMEGGWALATAVQAAYILAKMPGCIAWLISREHAPAQGNLGTVGRASPPAEGEPHT